MLRAKQRRAFRTFQSLTANVIQSIKEVHRDGADLDGDNVWEAIDHLDDLIEKCHRQRRHMEEMLREG